MITKIKYAIVKGLLLNIECFSLIIWQWFEIMSRFTVIIAFDSSVGRAMDCRSFTSISMGPVFESQSKDVHFLDFFVSSFGQSLYAIFSVFRVFVVWTNFLFPYDQWSNDYILLQNRFQYTYYFKLTVFDTCSLSDTKCHFHWTNNLHKNSRLRMNVAKFRQWLFRIKSIWWIKP